MVTFAIAIAPAFILGPKYVGTFKVTVNISSPSTMLSFITVMFTVFLVLPAITVTVCVAELKSTLPPTVITIIVMNTQEIW